MTAGKWLVLSLLSGLIAACVSSGTGLGNKDMESAAAYNLQLGIDYFRQGNLSEAKEKLDRSLEQNPRNTQAYVASGMLYDRLGEPRKADRYFAKAVSMEPENAEVINSYAVFLCRKGDYAKGEQMALQAAANPLYKTPEAAYLNAGNCALDAGRNVNAEEHFRRALSLRPNFAAALLQMAELEFNAGNYLPSRGFLERFQQVSKPTAASLWLLVRVEYALGNSGLSADYARRLKEDFPTSLETKALLELEKRKQS
ncbi:MAG: type IV pilus biogenesis/stability protein PilW [Steroidobacteraceae bacterium]